MNYPEEISARIFFTPGEENLIIGTIAEVENLSTGEIRLHLEDSCSGPAFERARQVFQILEMQETEERNGILLYIAIKDQRFAIFGDNGIDEKVPGKFWEEILSNMKDKFQRKQFFEGVTNALRQSGDILAKYFPYQEKNNNELPNSISTGASL